MAFIITSKSRGGATKPRSGPNTRFDQGFRNEFGLVGAWTLDSGPVMAWDLSGVGNHGRKAGTGSTIVNAASPHGRSLNFTGNGTDHDRFDLGPIASSNPLSLSSGDTVTIVWRSYLRTLDTRNNDYPRIFDKSNSGNAANGYAIWAVGTDNYRFMEDGSDSADSNASTTTDWENRAFTRNGTAAAFFLDGVDDTSDNFTGAGNFSSTTTNAAIGHWNHSTTERNWDGGIDYVYIFDQVLPDSIIARLASHPYEWITSTPRRTYFLPPAATTDSVFIVTSKTPATRKPKAAKALNGTFAGRRVRSAILFDGDSYDYATGEMRQLNAGSRDFHAASRNGDGVIETHNTGGTPDCWYDLGDLGLTTGTVMMGFSVDAGGGDERLFQPLNGGADQHGGLGWSGTGDILRVWTAANWKTLYSSISEAVYYQITLSYDGTNVYSWIKGIGAGTTQASTFDFDGQNFGIFGQLNSQYGHSLSGDCNYFALLDGPVSSAVGQSLADNPWQIWQAPHRTYFMPSAAGATTTTSDVPASDITLTAQPPTSLRSLITNIPAV